MKPPNHTGWLWRLALLIVCVAGIAVYFLRQDAGNINAPHQISMIILFAAVAIGICIISATAQWWMKH